MNKKNRLRRSMMFLNAQKPNLLKDPYIFGADSLIFDLEDAVALPEKDAARFTLFHSLKKGNFRGAEKVVRINGIDTSFWKEDIRAAVFAGCDSIRIPKTESGEDVLLIEEEVSKAEEEASVEIGTTLLMAAIESAKGVLHLPEICTASPRLFGVALSAGDYTKDLHTKISGTGQELEGARQLIIINARAAGIQCFDTVYTDLENEAGFTAETELIHSMGFDGKSIINPRQIPIVHKIFTPSLSEITFSEKVVKEIDEKRKAGIGVFTVDGKMIDIAFYEGAKRTLALAEAAGLYQEGENA